MTHTSVLASPDVVTTLTIIRANPALLVLVILSYIRFFRGLPAPHLYNGCKIDGRGGNHKAAIACIKCGFFESISLPSFLNIRVTITPRTIDCCKSMLTWKPCVLKLSTTTCPLLQVNIVLVPTGVCLENKNIHTMDNMMSTPISCCCHEI